MAQRKYHCIVFDCLDGRTQEPVDEYIRERYGPMFPDRITCPGIDLVMANKSPTVTSSQELSFITSYGKLSLEKHRPKLFVLVAHYDCAGNPVTQEEHFDHLWLAQNTLIKGLELSPAQQEQILPLWVFPKNNGEWKAEKVTFKRISCHPKP